MTNIVRYVGGQPKRGPSPALWGNVMTKLITDPLMGGALFVDDFINFSQHISAQNTQQYATYIDTGVTLKTLDDCDPSDGEIGVLEVAGNDADNDEGIMQSGGQTGGSFVISDTAGDKCEVYFECRIKKAAVTANALAFFVGLAAPGLAAANTLVDDTGALADNDFIGFQVLHDDGDGCDFTFKKASGTQQVIIANANTLTADTWVKLGFRYQPWAVGAKQIAVFVNGVEQGTYVTATQIATTNFPDAEELALLLSTKVGAAAESKFQMDWWAAATVLP